MLWASSVMAEASLARLLGYTWVEHSYRGEYQKPADFIATHPVFRMTEFIRNHRLGRRRTYPATRALISYHLRTGRIDRVCRGVFAQPGSVDPWLLGARLTDDAVVAYGGSLSFHGVSPLGYEMEYLTAFPRPKVVWGEVIYRAVRVSRQTLDRLAIETVHRDGLPVRVVRLEHALVDVLSRPDLGCLYDAVDHLRHGHLDLREVLLHARDLARPIVNARLGYTLSFRPGVRWPDVAPFIGQLPSSSSWFDPCRKTGLFIPRWRLRIPADLRQAVETLGWRSEDQRSRLRPFPATPRRPGEDDDG